MSAAWDVFEAVRLLESGPMHQDHLLEALGIEPEDDEDFLDELSELDEVCWSSPWHLALVRHVYGGNTFTHAVTAKEIAAGVMELGVDLAVMEPIDPGPYRVPDDCAPGQLVAVRWDDDVWRIERLDAPLLGDVTGAVLALHRAFDERVGRFGVASIDGVVTAAAMVDGGPFRQPQPPITELLDLAGLEHRDGHVAPFGYDWDDLARLRREAHIEDLGKLHGLSATRAAQLHAISTAIWRDGDIADASAALADPDVVAVFVEEYLDAIALPLTAPRLRTLCNDLGESSGADLLRARVAELDGDAHSFAAHVEAALGKDPGLLPALEDGGYLAYVRGDARRARELLRRAGAHQVEDERLAILRQFCEPPPGWHRNQPCPCGSGRKSKLCCLPSTAHPLEHRAHWLFDKITRFADRAPQGRTLDDFATDVIGVDVARRPDLFGLAMLQRPFWTFAAFEGGLAQTFAACAGALLPADERALLERWLPLRHRIVRLEAVDAPNQAVTFTDSFSAERFDAHVLLAPGTWQIGEEAVALLAPVGERGPQLLGEPVLFHESWRQGIVEAVDALDRDRLALARTCVRWELGAAVLSAEYSDY